MRKTQNANRNYKDSIFRALFYDEEKLRILYNALSGSSYPEGTHVEIVTLENSIFGDIANDLAFIIDNRLIILIDHQSSVNPNMPLRMLCHITKEYERYLTSLIMHNVEAEKNKPAAPQINNVTE